MLLPFFRLEKRNASFMQVLDRDFNIIEFVPYFNLEEYTVYHCADDYCKSPGEPGIMAFRLHNENIVQPSRDLLLERALVRAKEVAQFPVLKSQLLSLSGASLSELWSAWEIAAKATWRNAETARNWVSAEAMIAQNIQSLWTKKTNKVGRPATRGAQPADPDVIEYTYDELIQYLSNPRHYNIREWEDLWFSVESDRPLDEILFDIGYNWLSYKYSETGYDVLNFKDLICRLIQYEYVRYTHRPDFIDFLSNIFCDGLAEAVESGFPFTFHKMAIELAQDDMSIDDQLQFLSAALYFFDKDQKGSAFIAQRIIDLLEHAKRDSFRVEDSEIIDILSVAAKFLPARHKYIEQLFEKFSTGANG